MGIAVLGPLRVDGHAHGLGPRDRVVLSALVVNGRQPMSREVLADALWGGQPPASWAKVVYGCVSRLRKLLGDAAIETAPSGYRLTLGDGELDHRLFERLLQHGREALRGDDPARASFLADEGLGLWRGPALGDLEEWEPGRVEAARLEGLRMDAEELRVEAEVRSGHAPAVLEQARVLVAQAPFRETRWVLLATALYQSGRQRDALGAVQRARAMLVDELGLDPGRELADLEQKLLRQDPSLTPGVRGEASLLCPYRGLLPYDAEDADSFFGREDDIAACLRRLRDSGVLVVVGPSGVGKSSLVRAGVVASLTQGDTPVLVGSPGAHPVDSLAGLKQRGRQILVVDQAEEAITMCPDHAERVRYFAALVTHVGAGGGLVLSLRADHLGDLAPYPDIARILEDGLYLLGPMDDAELRRAIEGPAHRAGLRLEPGLVDIMVRDVEGEPAGLPMLSHVLRETWERREGATMTVEGYTSTGGIQHAVSQSAETLYDAMDEAQRARLRSLLLRLVIPAEDGQPVRARVSRDKVTADEGHRRIVEQLVEARLLTIDGDAVQIAHEALVRVWPRLQTWLDDDVEGQRLFRHLSVAAEAWEGMGRPDSELYRGGRLTRAVEWRDGSSVDLDETEAAFLRASVSLSEAEVRASEGRIARERRTNRRLRGALAGVALLLALALVTGFMALRSADQAREQRARAQREATVAEAGNVSDRAVNHGDLATSLLAELEALRLDATSAHGWENLASTLVQAGPLERIHLPSGVARRAAAVSVTVSADGTLVAESDPRQGVQLYDAVTTDPVPFGDDTPSSVIRFSPDGHVLAAAVNHWQERLGERIVPLPVRIYDLPGMGLSDRQLGGWPAGSSVDYRMEFSRDGRRLAAGVMLWDDGVNDWRRAGAVLVWDVRRPEVPVFEATVPDEAIVALSPNGRRVFTATLEQRALKVYDVDTGHLVRSAEPTPIGSSGVADLAVSPDGSTLAVAAGEKVHLLDTTTLVARAAALHGHAVTGLEYSHDGSVLAATSADGGVTLWATNTRGELLRLVGHAGAIWDAAFGPQDRTLYTTDSNEVRAWDLTGKDALLSVGEATTPVARQLALSLPAPDGRTIARIAGRRLWLVDDRTGQATARSRTDRTVWSHGWSPDSERLLTIGPGVLTIWDPDTGRLVGERSYAQGYGVVAAFSGDGERLHVHDRFGNLETLDVATLEPLHHSIRVGDVAALVSHPTKDMVIGVRSDGSVIRVEPETGKLLATEPLGVDYDFGEYLGGAVSPDGSLLAVRLPQGGLRLLDTDTMEWVSDQSPFAVGENIAFAPDGSQLASVDAGWVRLWDGRTGAYQAGIPLPEPAADTAVAYLPDGSGLLLSTLDGRTWTVDTRRTAWVERACRIAGRNLTQSEWKQFFPTRPYEVTCRQWPAAS